MNQNFVCSDPPEIELETNRVHSGINKEAHLTCRVQGNPEPEVGVTVSLNIMYVLLLRCSGTRTVTYSLSRSLSSSRLRKVVTP